MRFHHTDDAPPALGPYSQAVEVDGWLYLSGQVALDPVVEGRNQVVFRLSLPAERKYHVGSTANPDTAQKEPRPLREG